jgi:hypothetical protein
MPSENVERTLAEIVNLTVVELNELREELRRQWGDNWELSGVREPRRPNEPSDEDSIELEEPREGGSVG